MKAKYKGIKVTVSSTVDYQAPDAHYNVHRTTASTDSGVVLLEHTSKGVKPGVPPWLDQLTDMHD